MDLKRIYDIYKFMTDDYTLFSFKGNISDKILYTLLQTIEDKLSTIEKDINKRKKIYNIIVECLQNIYHHSESLPINESNEAFLSQSVIVMISKTKTHYIIKTGNYISQKNAIPLKEQLLKINTMSDEALRGYHNQILNDGHRSDKGTAGLGLIDIARKSKNKLLFDFIKVNDAYSFFCLAIKI